MSKLRRFLLTWVYWLGHWFGRAQQRIRRRSPQNRTIPRNRGQLRRRSQAGFILPTTSLLLVVVALTITAMSLRSLNRVETVAGDRQQKIIYNAATPAIDRAKSKLEKLFSSDPRRTPTGVPPEEYLLSLMLDDGVLVPELDGDPYTLPGETRIDLNGNGEDNAWRYEADTDGDGTTDSVIAYSITFKTPVPDDPANPDPAKLFNQAPEALKARASKLEVRSGPLQSDNTVENCNLIQRLGPDFLPPLESGWFQDASTTANLRKNFQINAVVVPKQGDFKTGAGLNTIATLELQQDKLAARGNRWAAWFRNDLEVFPGPAFNWNGAMHTEGSLFLASQGKKPSKRLTLYLVSSPKSCLYGLDASQLSASGTGSLAGAAAKNFDGDFVASSVTARFHDFGSDPNVAIHYQEDTENTSRGAPVTDETTTFTPAKDSVNKTNDAIGLTLDPLKLFTEDLSERRSGGKVRSGNWANEAFVKAGRTKNDSLRKPYLDDFYRADNRYGPRASYGGGSEDTIKLPAGTTIGTPIGANADLVRNSNPASNSDLGLDGYWERRAIQEGLRVIVGQRLELGSDSMNPLGYPQDPADFDRRRPHETLQRRSLRDVLGAVQGTLVYHHQNKSRNNVEPIAAMATVVHPGSPGSLKAANTFEQPPAAFDVRADLQGLFGPQFGDDGNEILTDFFEGRGTNGWEFDVDRLNQMLTADIDANKATVTFAEPELRKAVDNLALLSGDPQGAFPAVQEAGTVHPYPELTKWGNFSELNRSLSASADSPADQSNQQTAALTMGMLAYNLSYLDAFDYSTPANQVHLTALADELGKIGDKTANFNGSLPVPTEEEGSRGDPNLADSDAAAWSVPGTAPGGVRTDFLTQRRADYTSGKVDILRSKKAKDQPFSVRVYPAGSSIAGGSASALAGSVNDPTKYVEIKLSDAQTPAAPSPPFETVAAPLDWQDESPRVPPEAYVLALGGANGDPNTQEVTPTALQSWARLVALKEQVGRDRNFGFAPTFGRAVNTSGPNPKLHQFSYQIAHVYPNTSATNFSGVGEDNGDGVFDVGEDVNFNGRLDVQNEIGFDYNNDTQTDNQHEFDANGNGILDPDEDFNNNGKFDRSAWYAFGGRTFYQGEFYEFGCDFSASTGNNYFGFGLPTDFASERRFLHLATTLCPVEAKYPSLYYLFPTADHGLKEQRDVPQTVTLSTEAGTTTENVTVTYTQPQAGLDEQYLDQFLTDNQVNSIIGSGTFLALNPSTIAIKPTPLLGWKIPVDRDVTPPTACGSSAPVCSESSLIAFQATGTATQSYHHPAFIDTAFFNPRDLLVTRSLDLDLNMLRDSAYSPAAGISDTWLAFGDVANSKDGGLVYSFREDSLREDGIARPPSIAWANYAADPNRQGFRMLVNTFPGQDPPVNETTGISPKPVDYYPDPDRRAHGFRLRNGATIKREGGGPTAENLFGISVVTDNALYVKGDLNFHRSGGKNIEEFTQTLSDDYNNFYNRKTLNEKFAKPDTDDWRPVELLADIVSPLSRSFCEGSVQDSLVDATTIDTRSLYGCATGAGGRQAYTSFTNTNRPTALAPPSSWWHENRFDITSPPAVDLSGHLLQRTSGEVLRYPSTNFETSPNRARPTIPVAEETTMNAVIVSGVGPSRDQQSYGGLHNFPPLIERWQDIPLRISGAFLQLNFRTSSTGPFDADAWETNTNPDPGSFLPYYRAPKRRWGYDVALQYAPAGPIASRFVTLGDTRSEFYSEPTADDPYICLLRRQIGQVIGGYDSSDCDS